MASLLKHMFPFQCFAETLKLSQLKIHTRNLHRSCLQKIYNKTLSFMLFLPKKWNADYKKMEQEFPKLVFFVLLYPLLIWELFINLNRKQDLGAKFSIETKPKKFYVFKSCRV